VERHLAQCPRCAARRAEREEERRAFRDTAPPLFPPARAHPALPAAPARGRRRAWWLGGGAAAAAVAAAVVLVVVNGRSPDGELVTVKGRPHLRFFVRDAIAGTVREGAPGQALHPGDRLRFGFDQGLLARDPPLHVALLSRDASGKVTRYFPEPGSSAAARVPASPGQDGLLPFSILLDQTLGRETIYALYCHAPVPLGPLEAALTRSEAAPPWPPSCQVEVVRLEKTSRR
jgi:hypothetical protein